MVTRRLALLALVAAALAPGAGRAAVPVAVYPLHLPGLPTAQRTEVHALLQASLVSGARRGVLQPRNPLLLPVTCGDVPTAQCLAAAAKDGLVLAGRGERKSGLVVVTAALYDRNGARTREVRFVVDLVVENLRPVGEALAQLEEEIEGDGTVAGSAKPAPPPSAGAAKGAAAAAAIPVIPLPPPPVAAKNPSAAKPAAIDVSAPAGPPPVWKRQAGPFFTILGGALLAGGAVVGIKNKSLADDLDAKHAAGTLTAADASSYDQVHRYNVLSTALFAAGAVSVAAGTWIWITAPARPGDPALAVAGGRF